MGVSGAAEAGAVLAGVGVNAGASVGAVGGGANGVSVGGWASGGAAAGGPGYGVSAPPSTNGNDANIVTGCYAGAGVEVSLTNATAVKELAGPFDTVTFSVGVGAVSFSSSLVGVARFGLWALGYRSHIRESGLALALVHIQLQL